MSASPASVSAASAANAASFATFSGMHTNEDLSAAEHRRIQEEEGEEADEIVQELPIVLSQQLAQTLYLMQSPLRPPHRPYESDLGERISLKVKPIQKKVEMELRTEEAGVQYQPDGTRMNEEHGAQSGVSNNYDYGHRYSEKKLTLQAKPVPPKTNYCAGVLSNGVLHLTPIHAICRFKPSLSYIDAADAAAAAESELKKEQHRNERMREGRMTEEEEMEMEEENYQKIKEEENKNQLQTVIMKVKRKEYGGGAGSGAAGLVPGVMRKQTYAFLKQLEEKEEWIPLKLHELDTASSAAQYSKLLSSASSPPPIPFNVPAQHYLTYVNPPDVLEGAQSSQTIVATGDPLYLSFEERVLFFMRTCRVVHLDELCIKLQIVSEDALEVALRELANICWIVQGAFVLKSSIVYDRNWKVGLPVPPATVAPLTHHNVGSRNARAVADRVQLSREFILTQFQQRRVLFRDELQQVVQLNVEELDELLTELALEKPLTQQQMAEQGIPRGAQYEWKVPSDQQLAQYFPKLVALSDQQMPNVEAELRKHLSTTQSHPSRDPSTRGLCLPSTPHIVHQLSSAGFATNRAKPEHQFEPQLMHDEQIHPQFAFGSAATVDAWKALLRSAFPRFGILHQSWIDIQMQTQFAGVNADESLAVLKEEGVAFGPQQSYWMHNQPGSSPSRLAAAALFASNTTVTAAQARAALPKTLSEDKKADLLSEFAVFDSDQQAWQLKSGRP